MRGHAGQCVLMSHPRHRCLPSARSQTIVTQSTCNLQGGVTVTLSSATPGCRSPLVKQSARPAITAVTVSSSSSSPSSALRSSLPLAPMPVSVTLALHHPAHVSHRSQPPPTRPDHSFIRAYNAVPPRSIDAMPAVLEPVYRDASRRGVWGRLWFIDESVCCLMHEQQCTSTRPRACICRSRLPSPRHHRAGRRATFVVVVVGACGVRRLLLLLVAVRGRASSGKRRAPKAPDNPRVGG